MATIAPFAYYIVFNVIYCLSAVDYCFCIAMSKTWSLYIGKAFVYEKISIAFILFKLSGGTKQDQNQLQYTLNLTTSKL